MKNDLFRKTLEQIPEETKQKVRDYIDKLKTNKPIDNIIYKVDCNFGAPMGRVSYGERPTNGTRVYDRKVPMSSDGAYDKGGAYWGLGEELRVSYTKDLEYVHFYRKSRK